MSRSNLRTLLALAIAAAVASVPVSAQEQADSTRGWVPDEVRAPSSTRFT